MASGVLKNSDARSLWPWRLIVDPPGEPAANIERDEQLAREVRDREAPPFLRIYRWSKPAISLGRRQRPEELPTFLLCSGLPMVRRPTGGGAVLHRLDELTYSLAVKTVSDTFSTQRLPGLPGLFHESLRNELVANGDMPAQSLSVFCADSKGPVKLCFDSPVRGDLLYLGRKVAGIALRVWRNGLLIQGTIQPLPVKQEVLFQALERTCCLISSGLIG